MKLKRLFVFLSLSGVVLSSCSLFDKEDKKEEEQQEEEKFDYTYIDQELKYCYNYFMDTTNFDETSDGRFNTR